MTDNEALHQARQVIDLMQAVIAGAVEELDLEHQPFRFEHHTQIATDPDRAIGCMACWPGDGHWPCTTAMIANDLRALLP